MLWKIFYIMCLEQRKTNPPLPATQTHLATPKPTPASHPPILATTILHQPPQANKTQSQIQQKLLNPPPAITNSKSQTQKQIHKPQKK
jgi:hypothetical protein